MEEIGQDDVYKAERILDTKNVRGKKLFLIKWDGWDEDHNTWEPERNIIDKRLIEVFIEEKHQLNNSKLVEKRRSVRSSKDELQLKNQKQSDQKVKEKLRNSTQKSESKEDELRSVIRVAEGLRPLRNPTFVKNNTKSNRKLTTNDSASSDSSDINTLTKSTQMINLKKIEVEQSFHA